MTKNIEIIRETDLYPGKNNGYVVNVTYDTNGVEHSMEHLMHKPEVDLFFYLKEMREKLSVEDFNKLEETINNYGDFMYEKASDEAAMDNAGEDI